MSIYIFSKDFQDLWPFDGGHSSSDPWEVQKFRGLSQDRPPAPCLALQPVVAAQQHGKRTQSSWGCGMGLITHWWCRWSFPIVNHRKMIGKPWENDRKMVVEWDLMGFTLCYSNMAGWKIPELNGGVYRKSTDKWSIFQQAMFDYQRVFGVD